MAAKSSDRLAALWVQQVQLERLVQAAVLSGTSGPICGICATGGADSVRSALVPDQVVLFAGSAQPAELVVPALPIHYRQVVSAEFAYLGQPLDLQDRHRDCTFTH